MKYQIYLAILMLVGLVPESLWGQPPDWVAPAPANYSFSATAIVQLFRDDFPLDHIDDLVAFFDEDELLGLGSAVVGDSAVLHYFIVYSNQPARSLEIKVYSAAHDSVFLSLVNFPFHLHSHTGSIEEPFQVLTYTNDDAPISFSLPSTQITLQGHPFSPIDMNDYLISLDGDLVEYTNLPNHRLEVEWEGSLLKVNPIVGFFGSDTLTVIANELGVSNHTSTVKIAFEVVEGYPGPIFGPVPGAGIVKNDQFVHLCDAGDLIFMVLGHYMEDSHSCTVFDYHPILPVPDEIDPVPDWSFEGNFPQSVTIVAALNFTDNYFLDRPDNVLAGFIDGELRGLGQNFFLNGRRVHYLHLEGQPGDGAITFQMYISELGKVIEYHESFPYKPYEIIGSSEDPFVFNLSPLNPIIGQNGELQMEVADSNWIGELEFSFYASDCTFAEFLTDSVRVDFCVTDHIENLTFFHLISAREEFGTQGLFTLACTQAPGFLNILEYNCANTVYIDAETSCSIEIPDLLLRQSDIENCNTGIEIDLAQYPEEGFLLNDDSLTINVYAEITPGQTDSCSYTLVLFNRGEIPELYCPQDTIISTLPGNCEIWVERIAEHSVICIDFFILNNYNSNGQFASDNYPVGVHEVTFELYVEGEKEVECEFVLEIINEDPPNISCPADMVVATEVGMCQLMELEIDYALAGAVCGGVEVFHNLALPLDIGETVVDHWAIADNGEVSFCEQLITVEDNSGLFVDCPQSLTIDANLQCAVIIQDYREYAIISSNCLDEIITMEQIPMAGLNLITDSITVYLVAEDENGNSDYCTFKLKAINFGEEVALECPEIFTANTIEGECDGFANLHAFATTGCHGVTVSNSYTLDGLSAAGVYPMGLTEVKFEVFQHGILKDSCLTLVEVLDIEVPEIICPADIEIELPYGLCSLTEVDHGLPSAYASCGWVEIQTITPEDFYTGANTVLHLAISYNDSTAICEQLVVLTDTSLLHIDCPENISLEIEEEVCFSIISDLGMPEIGEICSEVIWMNNAPDSFPIGTIVIVYHAEASDGQTASCQQQISVSSALNPAVECPGDIEVTTGLSDCQVEGLDIGNLSTGFFCGEIDAIINNAPAYYNIGQTEVVWTVFLSEENELQCVQTITVTDTSVLDITCPENILVATDSGSCEAVMIDLGTTEVLEVCVSHIVFNDAPSFFGKGITVITHTAESSDGQTAECEQIIEVVDEESPNIVCPDSISILIPYGETEVFISEAEAAYWDNCPGVVIQNDYNSGGANAEDWYPIGITVVVFAVEDASGNSEDCEWWINISASGPDPDTFFMSGSILTWAGESVEGVELQITGNPGGIWYSGSDGDYEFPFVSQSNTVVSLYKNSNWLNGVSVTDLVMIQQHILGIQLFGSPYQMIAADANADGAISTIDNVLLMNLIIGLLDSIPGNNSWRFIPASFNFTNPTNPFGESWPEIKGYQGLNNDITEEDWIAMKTGDVSGDASESSSRITFGERFLPVIPGEVAFGRFPIEVKVIDTEEIYGLQLKLHYNQSAWEFDELVFSQSLRGLTEKIYAVDAEKGVIAIVCFRAFPIEWNNDESLFTLWFNLIGQEERQREGLKIVDREKTWMPYALGPDLKPLKLHLIWTEETDEIYALHQNIPNPFNGTTIISFELPRDMEVKLTILDDTGRAIRIEEIKGRSGLNQHTVDLGRSPTGLFYYQINTAEWSGMKKMIMVE